MILLNLLSACSDAQWRQDPAIKAAQTECNGLSGSEEYDCYEQQAVALLDPDICRLAGIWIDDMCLQAVYEAADDPSICERIYLKGVVPTCKEYYAQHTSSAGSQAGTLPVPSPIETNLVAQYTPKPKTDTPQASPTSGATSTSEPTLTSSPTPLYTFIFSQYDPDIFPAVDISHSPPLIASADEAVKLAFSFANTISMYFPVSILPEASLFVSYGSENGFQTFPLEEGVENGIEAWVAILPVTNEEGQSLQYYLEISVPEVGYTARYPTAGTINLFASGKMVPVELAEQKPVNPGEKVYDFYWGFGPDKVRTTTFEGYPQRVGPPALDVADDGRIALMDPVNERVIIFDPKTENYSSVPLPFHYKSMGDVVFDRDGQLAVLDLIGEEFDGMIIPVPTVYRLGADGNIEASTPVYAKSPSEFTDDLKLLDRSDDRMVVPFDEIGEVKSREEQRQKETWDYPYRFVEGKDPFIARFADTKEGVIYEVHSVSPLGAIIHFERIPQGYIVVFTGDTLRATWFDTTGKVLKDVTLPGETFSEIYLNGRVAVDQSGSLYSISSTWRGIEIHVIAAP